MQWLLHTCTGLQRRQCVKTTCEKFTIIWFLGIRKFFPYHHRLSSPLKIMKFFFFLWQRGKKGTVFFLTYNVIFCAECGAAFHILLYDVPSIVHAILFTQWVRSLSSTCPIVFNIIFLLQNELKLCEADVTIIFRVASCHISWWEKESAECWIVK